MFWKDDSGRQPQIITPENEGGDETNYPSLATFFDDPDVPFGPGGPPGLLNRLARHQVSLQVHCLLERERKSGPRKKSRERVPLRPSQPEPHLVPIPMSNGDDDQLSEVTVTV